MTTIAYVIIAIVGAIALYTLLCVLISLLALRNKYARKFGHRQHH